MACDGSRDCCWRNNYMGHIREPEYPDRRGALKGLDHATYMARKERVMRHKIQHDLAEAEAIFYKADKYEEQGLQKKAFEYMQKAAELGHPSAQTNLGNYYSSGKGVNKSDEKAAYWYKRSYLQGNDTGAFNLAIDKLRAKNLRAAIFWFERARALGSGEAVLELSKIYLSRRGGRSKAIDLLHLTQKMKRSEISEETKEEAFKLLSTLVESSR